MTRPRGVLLGAAAVGGVAIVAIIVAFAPRGQPPEQVAREYGRGLYANDSDALWPLISRADRRVKDEATFRRQHPELRGFTREALRHLAAYITASPVATSIEGDRARVTLRFRLPDANAAEIRTLMRDWDEDRLEQLPEADRRRIVARLQALHRDGSLPTIEGDETMELVREAGGWKIFLNWADGVRVRFSTVVDPAIPLDVTVSPSSVVLAPGERVRVSVKAKNTGRREVTTRASHRIEPEAEASHLALLQCPLLLPVRLAASETAEYESEYMLLADAPKGVKAFAVTYRFPDSQAEMP